jgi:hypothetical protein
MNGPDLGMITIQRFAKGFLFRPQVSKSIFDLSDVVEGTLWNFSRLARPTFLGSCFFLAAPLRLDFGLALSRFDLFRLILVVRRPEDAAESDEHQAGDPLRLKCVIHSRSSSETLTNVFVGDHSTVAGNEKASNFKEGRAKRRPGKKIR